VEKTIVTRELIVCKFTVIIPCFNGEKFIERAINSVLEQTYSNYELIVINDGSTDRSALLIQNLQSKRKFKVIDQRNSGLGAARNAGISAANGDFICFLDADDYWVDTKLEIVSNILDSKNVDLICHDEYILKNNFIKGVNRYGPYITFNDLLFKGNCLSPSAVCVRRKSLNELGCFTLDPLAHGVEDYDLWLKLAKCGCKFFYLHETLGYCQIHDNNMSSDSTFRDREDYLLKNYFNAISNNVLKNKIRKRWAIQFAARGWDLARNDEFLNSAKCFFTAFLYNPICGKMWKYILVGTPFLFIYKFRK